MTTLRHTRYQAAIIRGGAILLVQCAFRNGPTVWMLPGGGREVGEDEADCVVREVQEETTLTVQVHGLLVDAAADPPDGTYVRWQTYFCTVVTGEAAVGGGEGASAELVGVQWFHLGQEHLWPDDIREDVFLYPQLRAIRDALSEPQWSTFQPLSGPPPAE